MSTPISRRQFFRLRPQSAAQLMGEGRDSQAMIDPWIRPPGAARGEVAFDTLCERCGACAEACPFDVIRLLGPEGGSSEGTPMLEPVESPCRWCDGFECIQACPTGALSLPENGRPLPIGLAQLTMRLCLNEQGTMCDECAAVCPASVRAIRMHDRRPHLDANLCVGCGLCVAHCPAEPVALNLVCV